MTSTPGKAKHLESAISFFILAILLFIASVLVARQFKQEPHKRTTPAPLAPSDFKALSQLQQYNAENLYEKINGKADLYLEAGFSKLTCQLFAYKEDDELWMELFIYDMQTPLNAFSVYSIQKRPNTNVLSWIDPSLGYKTENALYFVYGRYYIEIVGSSANEKLLEAMTQTAKAVQQDLAAGETEIPEIGLISSLSDAVAAESIGLYLESAFGFEGLKNTFTAVYKTNGQELTIFLSSFGNEKDAKTAAEKYRRFLIDNGGEVIEQPLSQIPAGSVIELYGTTEIVFAEGTYVAGVHQAENQQAAIKAAAQLSKNLMGAKLNESASK